MTRFFVLGLAWVFSLGAASARAEFWPIQVSGMSEYCVMFEVDYDRAQTYAEAHGFEGAVAFETDGVTSARVMFCNDHSNQPGMEFDEAILGLIVMGPNGQGVYVNKTYSTSIPNSLLARHVFRSPHEIADIHSTIDRSGAHIDVRDRDGNRVAELTWKNQGSREEEQRHAWSVYSPRSSGWFGRIPFQYPFVIEGKYLLADYTEASHSVWFATGTPWDKLIQAVGPLRPIYSQLSEKGLRYKMGVARPY